MKNIDAFNIAVGSIFGYCYQNFPEKCDISTGEIGDIIRDSFGKEKSNYTNYQDYEYKIVNATVEWLVKSGYLWCDSRFEGLIIKNVVLTPKGLEALNSIPESLEQKQTFGETLSKGASALGKEAMITTVQTCLGFGAKLVVGN
ncbi:hypothetical protein [Vibrio europaeus]|uniref:hypothetical protein n=1 Tax=Vibrio europaeus TaxID=300876 RepID=UPI00233F2CE5|nr:hypothetical protein [Vibrio europaeus]MDC5857360.1 hypothetical protein [Vibrio europaeus]